MDRFFIYDFFVLRTPAFPVEALSELNDILGEMNTPGSDLNAYASLRTIFSDPLFLEAIYFASKDLHAALQSWLADPDLKPSDKLLKSLHRYYSRMCTRCTPYGLFAGCAYGEINDKPSKLTFAPQKIIKHVRFDMEFVAELSRIISANPEISPFIKFHTNNSLYLSGGRYIYVETISNDGKSTNTLSALTASPYIAAVIDRARSGATIPELTQCVLDIAVGVSGEAVYKFVSGLISMQVLTSEFLPTVNGDDYIDFLIDRLGEIGEMPGTRDRLLHARKIMTGECITSDTYTEIEKTAREMTSGKSLEVLQQDLFFRMDSNTINDRVISGIAKISERLWSAVAPVLPEKLEEFMRRFSSRYEEQEIPLSKALDPDTGIGYGLAVSGVSENMPLLKGLAIPSPAKAATAGNDEWTMLLFEKLKIFLQEKTPSIALSEEDIDRLIAQNTAANVSRRQNTNAYVFGSIIARSCEELDQGNFKFLAHQLHAYSAGKLLGRFARGDEQLHKKLLQCMQDEEIANPDTIVAEVVYMPEGRAANVVLRPVFRSFEIPWLCNASTGEDHTINVDDLLVSVRNKRVVLRSRQHGREVQPRITNAFNTFHGQATYQFLSDVSEQYIAPSFRWDWKEYADQPWLPRVEYRNFILARARWLLRKQPDGTLSDPAKLAVYFRDCRSSYHIPRYVTLLQGADNELFIDLENSFCRDQVARLLKKEDIILYEHLSQPEGSFIKGKDGSYSNQIIIPIGSKLPAFSDTYSRSPLTASAGKEVTRIFLPGSEWLYIKIYAGNKMLEKTLTEVIRPFVEKALREKAIDKWFFIRYYDAEGHLRLRLHRSENLPYWTTLLPALSDELSPLINSHQVAKMTIDTYTRELERYGGSTIGEIESLFFFDSVAVSDLLTIIGGDEGELRRWQMGLYGVDSLLEDFGCTISEKLEIVSSLRINFLQEFSHGKKENSLRLERSLNDKYRQHYPLISGILGPIPPTEDLMRSFKTRSSTWASDIVSLKEKLSAGGDSKTRLQGTISSLIHMHLNRLFLSRQRTHELVLYHYLSKYYQSKMAREKYLTI